MPKNLLRIIVIVVCVIVVIIILIPLLVNADRFRPTIQTQLQSSLGRQVTIGGLSLSLLAGGVKAGDIVIGDDPAFNKGPFLKAQSLTVGVKLLPLIFSRSIEVTGITISKPELTLVHSTSGQWNFSSLGGAKTSSAPSSPSAPSAAGSFSVEEFKISNGRITVEKQGGKPLVYEDVNVTAKNISTSSPIPFTVEAKTQAGGKLKVEGTAGPINQADAALSPLQAQVSVDNLDLATTGFIDPTSGIQGIVTYSGSVKSDGKTAHAEGQTKVDKLRAVPAGSPAKEPVSLKYASDYDLKSETGTLTQGGIGIGSSTIHLSGNYDLRGASPVVHMKVNGSQLPVKDIEGILPAVGVGLPSGASLEGGTININLALDGPVDRLVTTGTAQVSNTHLKGYDLASKMKGLGSLAGLKSGSNDTLIENLSSNVRVAPEGIKADSISVVVPSIGTLTGNGTVSSSNALDFHMVANVSGGVVGGMTKGMSALSGGKGGIPFKIAGTTSQPTFEPDMGGMMKGAVPGAITNPLQNNPVGGKLGGLLGGKKN
ncbi:MAG TPA: AsmA family protein [Candidatus Bathyarchaeia archaeon]|nr:AsmA family protein [Candidatus Bathyarchaeia archaeon]